MSKTYEEWLKYYANATKEQVIEELTIDNQEIERLNKKIEEIQKINLADHKYASEMEDKYITTNNIINELESYLKYNIETENPFYIKDTFEIVLNRLQELKGDSSNE